MLSPQYYRRHASLDGRQTPPPSGGNGSTTAIIVVVTFLIVGFLLILSYIVLRSLRKRHAHPRYIPTRLLKRKWREWSPGGFLSSSKGKYSSHLHDNPSVPTLHLRSENRSARNSSLNVLDLERAPAAEETTMAGHPDLGTTGATIDRNTSVRSVMTLPAYSRSVRENERVLGREGERDGIDVVIEAPETAEEEEARREEEMASLYRIRLQRRQEVAERDERRRRRREARARGDHAELQRLRQESVLAVEQREISGAQALIAEHQSQSRERRVSSVSYADLGIARHDGTRVRANSNESHRPLLDSAASMSGIRPWSAHDSLAAASVHRRDRSVSDVSDVSESDGGGESMILHPPFGRAGSDFEVVQLHDIGTSHSRQPSSDPDAVPGGRRSQASSRRPPSSINTHYAPPSYDGQGGQEEAPPYESPVQERHAPPTEHAAAFSESGAPVLPAIGRLPSIRIAEATPVETAAPTPALADPDQE